MLRIIGALLALCLAAMAPITHTASSAVLSESTTPLAITEIMYDVPGANTGRQWIEIINTSVSPIELGAKDVRLSAGDKEHLIVSYNESNTTLQAGGVAVIASNPEKFLTDWPGYTGTLYKSSFSLTENDSVEILHKAGTVLASAVYTSANGAKGDGNSLQLKGRVYVPGAPTPGTYSEIPPAALKPPASKTSSTNQAGSTSHTRSSKSTKKSTTYGKGMTAPADTASAASAGALVLPPFPTIPGLSAYMPVFSSIWFTAFLALLAFSSFSFIVLESYE